MSDIKNNIKNLEKCLELEKGTLENSFVQLDSLSASELLSRMIEEIITGIATSPAVFKRPYMVEGVTCVISNLSLLRTLFMEDYADGNHTVH
tara:strand:+ start:1598 stop:1873 length:276 start_codon:yes stop_codon:yes gene_type:complete